MAGLKPSIVDRIHLGRPQGRRAPGAGGACGGGNRLGNGPRRGPPAGYLEKTGITGATVGRRTQANPQTIVVSGVRRLSLSDARGVFQGPDSRTTMCHGCQWKREADDEAGRSSRPEPPDVWIRRSRRPRAYRQAGVTEPVIQKYGLGEKPDSLVELPGVENLDRVEEVIQSTAKLSIHQRCAWTVRDGPGCFAGEWRSDSTGLDAGQGLGIGWGSRADMA